ncbi:MaoC-like dehydratase [Hyaloraphidium curvatum]|nr:MaoC-like dehydratase [Hyaloraphidium curvatum]
MSAIDVSHIPETSADVTYNTRDALIYAVGIGCDDLKYVYELDPAFQVFPTFPVVLTFKAGDPPELMHDVNDFVGRATKGNRAAVQIPGKKMDPTKGLHGEQSIELLVPSFPRSGNVKVTSKTVGVWDGGKGAVIASENMIVDAATGKPLARLESSGFMLGAGGFGGPKRPKPALDVEIPKDRKADFSGELKTSPAQAVLYRLAGDTNPLHIDPKIAQNAGFKAPILHGLCTYGHAARSLISFFPGLHLRLFRVRFSSPVYPGETLVTEAWKMIEDANQVVVAFRTSVKERPGTVVLNQCVARFVKDGSKL